MFRPIFATFTFAAALGQPPAPTADAVDGPAATAPVEHEAAPAPLLAAPAPKEASSPAEAPAKAEEGAPDSADPLAFFKRAQGEVLTLVESKAPDAKLEARADRLLDYDWLAKQSLGGEAGYAEKCAPRCADYEKALTALIRENYLKRLRQAQRGSLDYVGAERRGDKAKVDTLVSFKSDDGALQYVKVSYVMHQQDGAWIVHNIITDGVSLAKTYRYEFGKLLRDGGIDRLIQQIEKQLAELQK